MTTGLAEVSCASLPATELPALASLRAEAGVEAAVAGDRCWVRWQPGAEVVLRRLLPVPGVHLYALREGIWHRPGCRLPAFEVPTGLEYRPLHHVLTPAPVMPTPARVPTLDRFRIRLVEDDRPRRTTAMRCDLDKLARWADTVPASRLGALQGALCQGRVLVVGERLPLFPSEERYWGEPVLVPLGYRPEPNLPADALREALGVAGEEILILDVGKAESVPRIALGPLTRAGIRLAAGEKV